jgi:hypothetical protein
MELGIREGVYTGMMPGYLLYDLAITDAPEAERAFNALDLAASPSGNYAEYQIYDDHSALQVIYETSGTLGDLTARYRPWEGGINGDALAFYLAGWQPDAAAGAATLAPRLPNDWPWMHWLLLRAGDRRVDLEVEERGGERYFWVHLREGDSLVLHLEVPLPAAEVRWVTLNGERLEESEVSVWSQRGQTRVRLPAFPLDPSRPSEVVVSYRLLP